MRKGLGIGRRGILLAALGSIVLGGVGVMHARQDVAAASTLSLLGEPLVAGSHPVSESERVALVHALSDSRASHDAQNIAPLTAFLQHYPHTTYAASLWLDIGKIQARAEQPQAALASWRRASIALGTPLNFAQRTLQDSIEGQRLITLAALGQAIPLQQALNQVGNRPLIGQADTERGTARDALWRIDHEPRQALRCGWVALRQVLMQLHAPASALRTVDRLPAHDDKGTSLLDLKQEARSLGYSLQAQPMVASTSSWPTPSVMHLKAGHFAALLAERGDTVLVEDLVLGNRQWIKRSVLVPELSGGFLALAHVGQLLLSDAQAQQVMGAGITPNAMPSPPANDNCDGSAGPNNQSQNNAPQGMTTCSIQNAQTDLNLNDLPLTLNNAVGPSLWFHLGYDQRRTNQPGVMSFSNVGPMWTYNWMAYIQDDPNNAGNAVSIYARNGGTYNYSGYDPSSGAFSTEAYAQAQLVRVSGDPITYERRMPDGAKEVYAQADGSTVWPRRIFLTQVVDHHGNAAKLNYDSSLRLTRVIAATGESLSFVYGNTASPLLIRSLTGSKK